MFAISSDNIMNMANVSVFTCGVEAGLQDVDREIPQLRSETPYRCCLCGASGSREVRETYGLSQNE